MKTIRISSFEDVGATLRNMDLRQALYDEGSVIMEKVLVNLHGDEHRTRRTMESKLFRRNFFRYYENEVFPGLLKDTLEQYLTGTHNDLQQLGYRIMVHLSLAFAGIDRAENTEEEADTLHQMLITFGHAATLGQFSGDREEVKARIAEALKEFDRRFYGPSRDRRQALVAQCQAGEIDEDDLPRDILTILLLNNDKLELTDELIMREIAFFYLAASHTSVHTLVHAANEVYEWCDAHPGAREELLGDIELMQRFVHESMRLHPSSPESWRRAEKDLDLPNGEHAEKGDKVVIDLQNANRDTSVFGDNAADFDPYRERPSQVHPAGQSFGGGMHVCLGMNLVAGTILRATQEKDPDNYQYGTIALVLHELFSRGMERDPERPAEKDAQSARDIWTCYPVVFPG